MANLAYMGRATVGQYLHAGSEEEGERGEGGRRQGAADSFCWPGRRRGGEERRGEGRGRRRERREGGRGEGGEYFIMSKHPPSLLLPLPSFSSSFSPSPPCPSPPLLLLLLLLSLPLPSFLPCNMPTYSLSHNLV